MTLFAWAFLLLAPLVVGAARYTNQLRQQEPSGIATALAAVTIAGAVIAVFLAVVSLLFLVSARAAVAALQPGVLPSFLILEVLIIVVPLYLRLLRSKNGKGEGQ